MIDDRFRLDCPPKVPLSGAHLALLDKKQLCNLSAVDSKMKIK
jgi:hypothetical protein